MRKEILFFDIETEVNPEAVNFIQVPSAPSNYNSWRDYQMISWSSESKYAPPMHWIDRTKKQPLK